MTHVHKKNSNKHLKKSKVVRLLRARDDADKLEEERLGKLVFGQGSKLLVDSLPADVAEIEREPSSNVKGYQPPAWTDTETGDFLSNRENKFEKIVGNPKWAELNRKRKDSASDDEDDSKVLQHCGNLIAKDERLTLPSGTIQLKRNRDLNHDTYTEGPIIEAVEFHPTSTVALVAGVSGIATLFQVDGRTNAKLQSIQFNRFPINCAKISISGTEFLVGSRHLDHFFSYDMESGQNIKIKPGRELTNFKTFELSPDGSLMAVIGRFGYIHLLTARTKELIGTLKMNGEVTAVFFNNSGSQLYAHGDGGEVYTWDTSSRACIGRFHDDGCISGTSLAVSDRYIAAGSSSGIVNIYSTGNTRSQLNQTCAPLKTLLHLRTPVNCLKFNSSEEVLAMASDQGKDAVRLVHLPSFTVFSNFPGRMENMARPQCLAFSPNSGYLAVGNNKNTALLFRLKHYGNY